MKPSHALWAICFGSYRGSTGEDLKKEKEHEVEIQAALDQSKRAMRFGDTFGAVSALESVKQVLSVLRAAWPLAASLSLVTFIGQKRLVQCALVDRIDMHQQNALHHIRILRPQIGLVRVCRNAQRTVRWGRWFSWSLRWRWRQREGLTRPRTCTRSYDDPETESFGPRQRGNDVTM